MVYEDQQVNSDRGPAGGGVKRMLGDGFERVRDGQRYSECCRRWNTVGHADALTFTDHVD